MTKLRRRVLFQLLAAILRRDEDVAPPLPWHSEELWQALLPLADQHMVAAALPRALQAMKVWHELPLDAAELLSALNELNHDRNSALKAQGMNVLTTLRDAGVRAVALKGLAYQLTGLHADDPGRRLMADLDILVAPKEGDAAQNILIAAGYAPDPDPLINEDAHHHLLPLYPQPQVHGPGCVEVHIGFAQARHEHLLPPAAVLEASIDLEIEGRTIAVPRERDLLDHCVLHGALQQYQQARRWLRLADAFDVGRLWSQVRMGGHKLSNLRSEGHPAIQRHLGACLLISGVQANELGPLAAPAKRHLTQVLYRQSLRARPALEASVIHNAVLLGRNPRELAAKLGGTEGYRNLIRLLTGRRTRPIGRRSADA